MDQSHVFRTPSTVTHHHNIQSFDVISYVFLEKETITHLSSDKVEGVFATIYSVNWFKKKLGSLFQKTEFVHVKL